MKSFVKVSLILMVLVSLSMAAWEYADRFPVTGGGHGIQVDPTGKIWFVSYYANDIVVNGADSIKFKSVYCFNDDGTQASFSPIRTLDVPGVGVDSMLNAGRGLGIDGQGNLLYSAYDKLYKIDYQTGECLGMVQPVPGASLTQAWGDANGYVYIGTVLAGNPIFIFDEDFEEYARVVEAADVISRALIVTPDGKDLYYSAVTGTNGVLRYHSEDGPDGTYEPVDTIGVDVDGVKVLPSINCINFDRAGNIWFASKYDVTPAGWWCVDPAQNYDIIDNLGTPLLTAQDTSDINKVSAPRGIAFNAAGTIAYTSDFESPIPFRIWNKVGVDVNEGVVQPIVSLKNFDLFQNYPNPFNPTTLIPFELKQNAKVTLEIYNLMGQKVVTLLDENRSAGRHEVRWDATGQATGTYLYLLKVDNKLQSKKMLFVK